MVSSRNGIFIEYPKEWLSKVPFESWVIPGIIGIVVFGIGNIISAIFAFRKVSNKSWIMYALVGGIFSMSIVAQDFSTNT